MPDYKIVFQPAGRSAVFPEGTSLLEAARQMGVGIEAVCGGQGFCARCWVKLETGEYPRHGLHSAPEHLSPPSQTELQAAKRRNLGPAYRLACMARLQGDVLLTVPEFSRAQKQVVYKSARPLSIPVDALVKSYSLALEPAEVGSVSDQERLLAGLESHFGLKGLHFEVPALLELGPALAHAQGQVTLLVYGGQAIISVRPGVYDAPLGLAVDIGSTTLAAYLCDLRSGELLASAAGVNPQTTYGDDIMSRISYCAQAPDGLEVQRLAVVEAINRLARQAALQAKRGAQEIMDCVLVGNSVMCHLVLGLDPGPLGRMPFVPLVGGAVDARAAELGFTFHPAGRVHVLPLIAGFVGADHVAALLAGQPHQQEALTLTVDIGTNGELSLGNRERMVCTSSPTGPALEGAQITHGMRAAPGAIERVRIEPGAGRVSFKVIGKSEWSAWMAEPQDLLQAGAVLAGGICGTGILEAVAELYSSGALLPSGRFNPKIQSPRLVKTASHGWAFILAWPEQTSTGQPVLLSQADVRAIQLAKGALLVSARLLMQTLGVEKVDQIVLAGAFGTLVDAQRAQAIGMLPPCPPDKIYSVGNAAGDGARIALLNRASRQEAAVLAHQVEHILAPLSLEFQTQFADALAFPE
jgi:uncharacterized 2Fe-2S/4Fe-4S cluster protein (DUF4445 family)